jgi:hypothetical protein
MEFSPHSVIRVVDPSTVTCVALYRMDVANRRWHEVDEIGDDRGLLWSVYGGGCCPVTTYGSEPNCVYWRVLSCYQIWVGAKLCLLDWINPEDTVMHVFDVAARTKRVCYQPFKDLPERFGFQLPIRS